jgi:hypothetical protein
LAAARLPNSGISEIAVNVIQVAKRLSKLPAGTVGGARWSKRVVLSDAVCGSALDCRFGGALGS